MVWLLLVIILGGIAVIGTGVVMPLPGIALIVLGLMAAVVVGERMDRGRQRGAHDPAAHFDPNRGQWHGDEGSWQVPTPYSDHPDGGGTPPGVERDERP